MSKIKIGPFTEPQIKEIQHKLDTIDKDYTVEVDESLIEKYQEVIASKMATQHHYAGTSGFPEAIYLHINPMAMTSIESYLSNLGIVLNPDAALLEDNEFFCPQCDYKANFESTCPAHAVKLVEYFESIRIKDDLKKQSTNGFVKITFVATTILISIYYFTR